MPRPRTAQATPVVPPARLDTAVPILRIRSLDESIAHYIGVLGFKLDWKDEACIACVSRDQCRLMLCEGDQGHAGGWVWIGTGDVRRLHAELVARGARIRQQPTNHPWACELQVEDPDGNVIRFGSPSIAGEAFGPWLDMNGRLWERAACGGWACMDSGVPE